MRDWLEIFMMESPQDFFLNGSKQIDNFKLLMNVCRMPTLSKTSRIKKWTTYFVADKLAILLVLCQQVVDEREERKRSGLVGHYAQPRKKLRRTFAALNTKYVIVNSNTRKINTSMWTAGSRHPHWTIRQRALVFRMGFCGTQPSKEAGHQKDGGSHLPSEDKKESQARAHCTLRAPTLVREYHWRRVWPQFPFSGLPCPLHGAGGPGLELGDNIYT